MEVRIKVSKSTFILIGAALGVTLALITPTSIDADDKKKQEKNNHERKNAATNTSENKEKSQSKFYGDKTISEILEKAKSGIRKIWDQGWRVVLMNSKTSSNMSSGIYVDAQSSFPKTDSQMKEIFDSYHDSSEIDSTLYTPFAKLNLSKNSSRASKFKQGLSDIATGYRRANTSKNDAICKNFPRQSTLIEAENEIAIEDNAVNENTGTTNKSNSNSESNKSKKLVLSFRTPFSPVIRVFQAVKKFKRAKKRAKKRGNANTEIYDSNEIQEVVETVLYSESSDDKKLCNVHKVFVWDRLFGIKSRRIRLADEPFWLFIRSCILNLNEATVLSIFKVLIVWLYFVPGKVQD